MITIKSIYAATLLSLLAFFLSTGCTQRIGGGYGTPKPASKWTMRPYEVNGVRYYPVSVAIGDTMEGISSWYGPNFHGKLTSNGERYNMHAFTAAHKTWPMNTIVKVTNLQNGKSTIVRINDRGPFVKGRIIDCSYAAGKQLGLDKSGLARVRIEVIGGVSKHSHIRYGGKTQKTKFRQTQTKRYQIQAGAFDSHSGAKRYFARLKRQYPKLRCVILAENGVDASRFKVRLGDFKTKEEARDIIRAEAIEGAFVVEAT